MKVTFLYPDVFCKTWHYYQYGIASLSASLKKAGHATGLIHMNEPPERRSFLEEIERRGTEVLAVSSTSGQWRYVRDPIRWVREEFPKIHIVAGGIHPSLVQNEIFSSVPVDAVCVGEAERPFAEYLRRLSAGEDRSSVPNFHVKLPSGEIRANCQEPLLQDLDELPMADHDLFGFRRILQLTGGEAYVMATRGCPFRCAYCSNEARLDLQKDLGENMRYRSPARVLDEVEYVRDTYGAQTVYFIDDIFTMNREWLPRFCEEYGRRGRIPFKIQIQVKTVDYERLAMMREVGLYSVVVGVESGDDEIRKKILAKRIRREDILGVFQAADSLGIQTASYNMIGVPGETERSIRNSIEFNKELNPNRSIISIFTPFPGTSLYEECRRTGLVEDYTQATYFDKASFLPIPGISRERLEELYEEFTSSAIAIAERKARRGYYDFLTGLEEARIRTQDQRYVYVAAPWIDMVERKSLSCHPFSELAYGVKLRRGSRLKFGIAMDPEVWKPELGQGVIFRVEVRSGLKRRKVFERHINPKRNELDRHWHNHELDLSKWGGRRVKLFFSTHVEGSNDYCSSYWAEPHLVAA